ncbi:UNVERIFIED_CONTAM: hypothetical protein FKN15_004358 [Acipenser sinensis]
MQEAVSEKYGEELRLERETNRLTVVSNGYIEGKELENFFTELEKARRGAGVGGPSSNVSEKMKEFMQNFDKNADGRIELSELAQILPTEENFLLCFRQFVSSSSEFMEGAKLNAEQFNAIFTFYDKDGNGYIDEQELDALLKDLYEKNKKQDMDIHNLTGYRQTIMSLSDGGKLYRKELEIVLCGAAIL